ncbi:hypothetical protein TIFTF001_018742 [Ficus carica]|uniref:Uncharacterized protein n=1 Tax=Ficus carica TaxID=3494 RepID=A0AA88AS81_FICCA|nr:hypothetical protein TIFTF001_018742 [Ficus carica]
MTLPEKTKMPTDLHRCSMEGWGGGEDDLTGEDEDADGLPLMLYGRLGAAKMTLLEKTTKVEGGVVWWLSTGQPYEVTMVFLQNLN